MTFCDTSLQIAIDEAVVLIEGSGEAVCAVVKLLIVERRAHVKIPHAEVVVIVVAGI